MSVSPGFRCLASVRLPAAWWPRAGPAAAGGETGPSVPVLASFRPRGPCTDQGLGVATRLIPEGEPEVCLRGGSDR